MLYIHCGVCSCSARSGFWSPPGAVSVWSYRPAIEGLVTSIIIISFVITPAVSHTLRAVLCGIYQRSSLRGATLTFAKYCAFSQGARSWTWKVGPKFFLNVFILYRYCSLWNRVMAFSQHWAFWNNEFYNFSPIAVQNNGFTWSGKTENHFIYSHNW